MYFIDETPQGGAAGSMATPSHGTTANPAQESRGPTVPLTDFVQQLEDYAPTVSLTLCEIKLTELWFFVPRLMVAHYYRQFLIACIVCNR